MTLVRAVSEVIISGETDHNKKSGQSSKSNQSTELVDQVTAKKSGPQQESQVTSSKLVIAGSLGHGKESGS